MVSSVHTLHILVVHMLDCQTSGTFGYAEFKARCHASFHPAGYMKICVIFGRLEFFNLITFGSDHSCTEPQKYYHIIMQKSPTASALYFSRKIGKE